MIISNVKSILSSFIYRLNHRYMWIENLYIRFHTDYQAENNTFIILANMFKKRTAREWDKSSFYHLDW